MDEDVEVDVAEPGRTQDGAVKVRLVREPVMEDSGPGAGCGDEFWPRAADEVHGRVEVGDDDVGNDILAGTGDHTGRVDELDVKRLGPVTPLPELSHVRPEVRSEVGGRCATNREPVRPPRAGKCGIAGWVGYERALFGCDGSCPARLDAAADLGDGLAHPTQAHTFAPSSLPESSPAWPAVRSVMWSMNAYPVLSSFWMSTNESMCRSRPVNLSSGAPMMT